MWSILFSWPVVGILVPVLIGIGVGVMSMSPPEFWIARSCFSLAALILLARVGAWIIYTQSSVVERIIVAFLIFGVVGVGWVESLRWVDSRQAKRETAVAPPSTSTEPPVLATIRFSQKRIESTTPDLPYG